MEDLTPEEQTFSVRHHLTMQQLPQQNCQHGYSGSLAAEGPRAPEMRPGSSSSARHPGIDGFGLPQSELPPAELLMCQTVGGGSGSHPTTMSADHEQTCTKSQRLQLMQKTLMEQQQQLLRQREQLQHQQLLLSQRAQERNATPQSLAQLFAELHQSRQLQLQHSEPRLKDAPQEQKLDGQTADSYRGSTGGSSGGETGGSTGGRHYSAQDANATFGFKADGTSLCWADRRRVLRAVALLDADTVLKCTLRSLGRSGCTLQVAGAVPLAEGSRRIVDNEEAVGADTSKARQRCPGLPHFTWNATQNFRGQYDLTGGKVLQVHGQPLPAAVLFAGFSSGAPWRHCLRVTLSARRCAIRTRRCWRALVPLFPRRNAYTPAAVLSEDDVDVYADIGPRVSSLAPPTARRQSWKPPREPFTTPGIYIMTEEGGSTIAAWAVAADKEGHLRRRVASIESTRGDVNREATVCKRKRPAQQPLLPGHAVRAVLGNESGSVSRNVNALEEWYSEVAQEPLRAQKCLRLTLAEYAEGFAKYAEELIVSLEKLIETRQAAPLLGREAHGCGCSCSICVGLPCRVRLAWRRQLMAFEVAVDKPAAARHHSDSSVEDSDRDEPEVASRVRLAAAGRSRRGRWEWCRRCPLGCRMQLCLIFHELYQPLVLTGQGLRSALAHVLLRLRRYVTLSPLASDFLMQRVGEIRLSSAAERENAGEQGAADELRVDEADTSRDANWSTRDWAEVCWQRREHRRHGVSPTKVVASDDLDRSVARLSMLSSPLLHPELATEAMGSAHIFSAVDNEYCSTYPLLPEARDSMLMDGRAADQLKRLDVRVSHGHEVKLADGLETLALRAAAAAAVGMSCEAEETANNMNFSYPVSIASSPSACSTPPRQSSRPGIGRCFAIPRSSSGTHIQTGERAPENTTSPSLEECQLHVHCDGMAKARRCRGAERDEGGRGGYGKDGHDGDALDVSPRRLRRAQRARLTSEEPQLPPPRRVDVSRRVMPLVPWWWDDYVKTGEASTAAPTASKVSGDCASDGSSSVSSTISLTASPHLFRLRCREMRKLPLRRGSSSRPNQDFLATPDASTGVSEAAGKRAPTSVGIKPDINLPAENLHGAVTASHGEAGDELVIELIHAAAQLVDSLDSWPLDFGALGNTNAREEAQGRGLLSADILEDSAMDARTAVSPGVAYAPGLFHSQGRRSKQTESSGVADTLGPRSSHGLLTFVSSVLTAPPDEEAESLRGFELLQGVLRMLFSSSDALQEDAQETSAAAKGTECTFSVFPTTQPWHSYPQQVGHTASLGRDFVDDDRVNTEERRPEVTERSVVGRFRSSDLFCSGSCPNTPLLRSLAASAAPAMEPALGGLAVDDFYLNSSSKRAISYRDTYEPFDKDYTDIQIRLKPLRAFGLRQQRYPRHRRRSWRQSSQSAASSPRYDSPAPSAFAQKKALQSKTKERISGSFAEQPGTVRIGGRRVVVRTIDGGFGWASREPSAGGLSDFSVSHCSMSVDSSLSSRGMSLCSRATSNTGSASDASLQGGGTPQSSRAHDGPTRSRRGRSRPPSSGRTAGGGGNSSTPTGVYLDVARKLWRCQWRENGRFKTKSFPLNQYKTLKEARRACVIFRCLMGGWEVQPAWLGDDEGADIEPSEQVESESTPSSPTRAALGLSGAQLKEAEA
ncbi:hypothetical protein Esti_003774 [Eimeria stiedai]